MEAKSRWCSRGLSQSRCRRRSATGRTVCPGIVWRWNISLLMLALSCLVVPDSAQGQHADSGNDEVFSCDDEKLNSQAVKSLHEKLDDDQDGEVEVKETSDFVRNEFAGASGSNGRYKKFHANDSNISLPEMTAHWQNSNPAYNWSTAELVYWLQVAVGMPQYSAMFVKYKVHGRCLPRIALNKEKFLQNVLGVTKREDRSRLKLRAMEAVLFGPVFPSHFWYHVGLGVTTLVAIVLSGYVVHARRLNLGMAKMLEETHSRLQDAQDLKDSLAIDQGDGSDDAGSVAGSETPKSSLDMASDTISIQTAESMESQMTELRQHIVFLNRQLDCTSRLLPPDLLKLLCHTYQRETAYYNTARTQAEKRLKESEDAYTKFKSKVKNSFLPSSIKLNGGRALQELDQCIRDAQSRLSTVSKDRQERDSRWRQIEKQCHFKITDDNALSKIAMHSRSTSAGQALRPSPPTDHHRLSRKGPKASTFSGTPSSVEWEEPRDLGSHQSPLFPDGSVNGAPHHRQITPQHSSTSFGPPSLSGSHRSLSPNRKHGVTPSSSAHNLQRMPEIDEPEFSPQAHRRTSGNAKRQSREETSIRRRSDETDMCSRRAAKKPASTDASSFSKSPSFNAQLQQQPVAPPPKSADRQWSDPGGSSPRPPRVVFEVGHSGRHPGPVVQGDVEAPESEV